MDKRRSREMLEGGLPLVLVAGLFALGLVTLLPFLPAILWGVILSIALAPLHARLARAIGWRFGATAVVSAGLVVLLLLPMALLARGLIAFLPDAVAWVRGLGAAPPAMPDGSAIVLPESGRLPDLWSAISADLAVIRDNFGAELKTAAAFLLDEGKLVGGFVIEFALGILIATVLLHRADAAHSLVRGLLQHVGGAFATTMGGHAVGAIRSTVTGLLGSAAAQAAVAAVAYIAAGLPHVPVLVLLTFLLAMVQSGPVLVWGPAAVWLWVQGEPGLAVFLVAWSLVVMGLAENLVRTVVVSRGTDIPALLAFLGALGGLLTWGIVGIFVGPVIVGVCHQLVVQWVAIADEPGPPAA